MTEAGIPKNKIIRIDDAVDLSLFSFTQQKPLREEFDANGKVLIGIVGRIVKHKRQLQFLKIAERLGKKLNNVCFFIVGESCDENYYQILKKFIRDKNLSNIVHFTGRREDIPQLLSDLDILISFSGGSVMFEAMACRTCVISAWVTTEKDSYHIQNGKTAFLVPEKSITKVADVILQLVNHEKLRKQISKNAEAWAQKMLSHKIMADKTQHLYEMLLEKKQ